MLDNVAAATVLGRVAGLVGRQHQRRSVVQLLVHAREADAGANVKDLIATFERELGDRGAQALGEPPRVVPAAAAQDHREFVAAEAEHLVVDAQAATQQSAEVAQQAVAGRVPAVVVDRLEAVEVDVQQGGDIAEAAVRANRVLDALLEGTTVGEAGERVVACLPGKLDGRLIDARLQGVLAFGNCLDRKSVV